MIRRKKIGEFSLIVELKPIGRRLGIAAGFFYRETVQLNFHSTHSLKYFHRLQVLRNVPILRKAGRMSNKWGRKRKKVASNPLKFLVIVRPVLSIKSHHDFPLYIQRLS